MRRELATIVVPAYNVEAYIGECLSSLLSQTYKNIEIIVVDDGSTDETARLVQLAAESDSRVRLFRNENHGVSYSRNFAIERGEGEFLLFVDADDMVSSDYVEALVAPLARMDCECSVVGLASFTKKTPRFTSGESRVFKNAEVYAACLGVCNGFLCNKGFLYSIVRARGIRLSEDVAQSEDMLFLLDYLAYCGTLMFDTGNRYGYRQRRNSAANSHANSRWFDALEVYEAYESRLGDRPALAESVHRAFLPIAYEARWRYHHLQIENRKLFGRIVAMQETCERGLSNRPLLYRLKMFVYRHFMGVEMHRRKMVAR